MTMWTEAAMREALDRMAGKIDPEPERDWLFVGDVQPCAYVPTCEEVLHAVSKVTSISAAELKSDLLFKVVVRARQIYFYAARQLTGKSLLTIARVCGRLDHTTVLHGVRRVELRPKYYQPHLGLVMMMLRKEEARAA
jgi:hypothetical protein